ncbi:predicted protein [Methanosarcina acetivorans C2A]|uniref:Uncharacterized protein n=1 Tax=Methanosarcina acetivorans (strain ATCC 35395 / DSM 2834 / JCM 12185 / C2A) TaxID=188937 RepID=Q8TRI7_METAC|nr:predicted protein [Methanosarcina acetivorans C2A]
MSCLYSIFPNNYFDTSHAAGVNSSRIFPAVLFEARGLEELKHKVKKKIQTSINKLQFLLAIYILYQKTLFMKGFGVFRNSQVI